MKAKKIISIILVLSMVFTLVGCGESGDAATKPNEDESTSSELAEVQEFKYATKSDVLSMDPAKTSSVPNWAGQALVYENLVIVKTQADNSSKVMPGMAEKWDISDDGLTYTFHLRDDAKWADGVDVTAEDFEYTWRRLYNPNSGAVYEWMVDGVIKNSAEVYVELQELLESCKNGDEVDLDKYDKESVAILDKLGVKALDENTFEMKLEKPSPFFLLFVGFPPYYPVREDLIAKYGDKYGSVPEKIVGNGPFILTKWEPGASMVYVKNDNYWNKDEVYLTKVTRQIISESNAVAQALMNNEVDSAGIDKPEWNEVIDATGIYDIQSFASPNLENFIFNCQDDILKNKNIRLAISLAFDREKYNNEALEGVNIPAYSMVPSCMSVGNGGKYYDMTNNECEYIKVLLEKYDPKELLLKGMEELGLGDDPSKLEIHYMTRGTSEFSKMTAEWTQQQLHKALGINFVIDMTEWNIMYDKIDQGEYQIAQGGWTADYDDPSNFLDNYASDGYYGEKKLHWTGAEADAYTDLIHKAKASSDDTERANMYAEAEKILLEEAAVSPQYSNKIRTLVGKYVEGYYVNPMVYQNYVGVKIMKH